ncbi:MAG: ThuA domain-containing protein [Puniceicoccales bacterium]|jgi:type 1 glutamine amidotransferase|nr:ThuA domain-containing protein [Puniceicoccales bacterium]
MRISASLACLFLGIAAVVSGCCSSEKTTEKDTPFEVLVYTRTQSFKHGSIPNGVAALEKMAPANDFTVQQTDDPAAFTDENLKRFAVVVFMNTSGNVLDDTGKAALKKFVESGGGFVGLHAATDTEFKWPWYGTLVGARFTNHPKIQPASIKVVDAKHPATTHLPNPWQLTEEWYNFKELAPDNHVLLNLDETSYKGGTNGANHPMAWTRIVGKGRVFYTGLGHRPEIFTDPDFVEHLRGGLLWTAGRM